MWVPAVEFGAKRSENGRGRRALAVRRALRRSAQAVLAAACVICAGGLAVQAEPMRGSFWDRPAEAVLAPQTTPDRVRLNPIRLNPVALEPIRPNPITPNRIRLAPIGDRPIDPRPVRLEPISPNPIAPNRIDLTSIQLEPIDLTPISRRPAHAERLARGGAAIEGAWTGAYVCNQGVTGLTLSVAVDGASKEPGGTSAVRALFEFYAVAENPDVPAGCFEMVGDYEPESGRLNLTATRWLKRPENYVTVDLLGAVDAEAARYAGAVRGFNCGGFDLSRAPALSAPPRVCVAQHYSDLKSGAPR